MAAISIGEVYHVEIQCCQSIIIAGPQSLAVQQRLPTRELVALQTVLLGRSKQGTAFILGEATDRNTIDTEHKRLKCRADTGHITSGVDNACLQGGGVRDLEQRVDIF